MIDNVEPLKDSSRSAFQCAYEEKKISELGNNLDYGQFIEPLSCAGPHDVGSTDHRTVLAFSFWYAKNIEGVSNRMRSLRVLRRLFPRQTISGGSVAF